MRKIRLPTLCRNIAQTQPQVGKKIYFRTINRIKSTIFKVYFPFVIMELLYIIYEIQNIFPSKLSLFVVLV